MSPAAPNRVATKRTAPDFKDAPVAQYTDMAMYEHYNASGYLLLITSDPDAITLEPGDFVVKRAWRTDVVPYIHTELPGDDENSAADTAAGTGTGCDSTVSATPRGDHRCGLIQCATCFPQMAAVLARADRAMRENAHPETY